MSAQIKLGRRHAVHFMKRDPTTAVPVEVKPGWRKENWARWTNPLERWLQRRRESHPYDPTKSRDPLGPDARGGDSAPTAASAAMLPSSGGVADDGVMAAAPEAEKLSPPVS